MEQLKRRNFELEKLKVSSEGKVSIKYFENIPDEETTRRRSIAFSEEMMPHPDMMNLLTRMKRMLAYQLGLTSVLTVVDHKDFAATKAQKKYVEKYIDEVLGKVNITGISLSGEGLSKLKITGSYDGIGLAGKLFSLEGESQGFEEEASEIVSNLEDEAYEYIFNLKRQQLEMFGQEVPK